MTDLSDQPAKSRKGIALAAGGAVLAVAAVGGGIWGYQAFYGQGDQPAQALPADDVVGYAALDLSPNGDQLLSARSTLKKFPGLAKELDLDSKDDLRKIVFEKIQDESDSCPKIDYAKDIEPWLGDRVGFAFIDAGKGKEPTPALVFQATDTDKAEAVAPDIADCLDAKGTEEAKRTSHAVSDGWLVLAEGKGKAARLVKDSEEGSLADDDKFQKWTDAAGDPGIVTAYAAPLFVTRLLEDIRADGEEVPKEVDKMVADFDGGALVARFRDDALEVETATDPGTAAIEHLTSTGDLLGSLPKSTVAALGFGLEEDGFTHFLEEFGPALEDEAGLSMKQAEAELKKAAGIDFGDIETLFGEGVALAIDSEIDGDVIEDFDFTALPVALKIKGDTKEIEKVIDTLRETASDQLGMPRGFVVSKTSGDYVIVSTNADYADKLADEKGLGTSKTFQEIVPDAKDSVSTMFVDFDVDNWLDDLLETFEAPKDVRENVEPLSGFGLTQWTEDKVAHALFRLTTN